MTGHLSAIIQAVHAANPHIRIIGFGYDILGGDKLPVCPFVVESVFPQCRFQKDVTFIECWNEQFVRLDKIWQDLAANFSFVDTVSLLGSLQTAGHNPSAAVGVPDMSTWSPNHLVEASCIHATQDGFLVIFENLWNLYWSKMLGFGTSAI